jgi:hypothetical protein
MNEKNPLRVWFTSAFFDTFRGFALVGSREVMVYIPWVILET